MVEKKELFNYIVIGMIFLVLISFLFILRGSLTGYAIFQDSGSSFNGTFNNTQYNGSGIILSGSNLTGTYTSRIFDASSNATWNNITTINQTPSIEFFFGVDGNGDVYKSLNLGSNWSS